MRPGGFPFSDSGVPARAATLFDDDQGAALTTATKTRPKADALAALAEREQAWADAKGEADRLGSEFDQKFRQAEALGDERRRLIHHEPGLVDHHGNPVADDNAAAAIDRQLTALGDLADLHAQADHARKLEERAKQAATDYTCAQLDALLAELQPQAEATATEVARCMAELAEASTAYLNMARRVDGLRGTDRNRHHLRVPAIDTGSDLLNLSRDFEPPPLPTEIR
jgi:hypothetical protein